MAGVAQTTAAARISRSLIVSNAISVLVGSRVRRRPRKAGDPVTPVFSEYGPRKVTGCPAIGGPVTWGTAVFFARSQARDPVTSGDAAEYAPCANTNPPHVSATVRRQAAECFSAACERRSTARKHRPKQGAWPRCSRGPAAPRRPARRAARMQSGWRTRPER